MLLFVLEARARPLWTDEWMVWLTAASVAVSGLLGFLAYWNGRRAGKIAEESTRIAKDAADRDESHRLEESHLRADRERAKVALSMLTALHEMLIWVATDPEEESEIAKEAASEFKRASVIAQSQIGLYCEPGDESLRVWFSSELTRLENLAKEAGNVPAVHRQASDVRKTISEWRHGRFEPPET